MNIHGHHTDGDAQTRDRGFTLVEVLIVIVILGIVSTITVLGVRGIQDKGQDAACSTDRHVVEHAVAVYMAQSSVTQIATAAYTSSALTGNTAQPTAIPAPPGMTQGTTPVDTLVRSRLLNSTSTYFFVRPNGALVHLTAKCDAAPGDSV